MQAVECCHYILVFCLAILVRERNECVTGNGHNLRRVIKVHLLLFVKTIDHILHGLVHLILGLWSSPKKHRTIFRPHHLQLLHLSGSFVVHERRGRNERRIAMIVLLQQGGLVARIFQDSSRIPLATALYGRQ